MEFTPSSNTVFFFICVCFLTCLHKEKSGFNVFSSTSYGGGTVLFSDSSTMFLEAGSDNPETWMGRHYHNALRAMDCKPEGEPSICPSVHPSVHPHFYHVWLTYIFPHISPCHLQGHCDGACCPAVNRTNALLWLMPLKTKVWRPMSSVFMETLRQTAWRGSRWHTFPPAASSKTL